MVKTMNGYKWASTSNKVNDMTFDYIPYRVNETYLSALFNGDYSGLDDTDDAAIRRFEEGIPDVIARAGAIGPGHWARNPEYPEEDETGDYGFSWTGDDVTGMAGNIAHLAYMFPIAG